MTLADALRRNNSPSNRLPHLFVVTDETRQTDPIAQIRRLKPGSAVIFRHYSAPDRPKTALIIAKLCRQRRLVLLIAADWRLAARLRADGVHLPEHMARSGRCAALRLWARGGKLISAAAHSRPALAAAYNSGAHLALLSPAFATASHPDATVLGSMHFAALSKLSLLPVIALGGMNAATWARLPPGAAQGAAAIAVFT